METLISIVSVVLGIGWLIFIHELGHFAVAKWRGVRVERFSIGFGPAIWEIKKGDTWYSLCWIPLGGYVLMLNADGSSEDEAILKDPGAFHNKPVGARLAIMSAGVIMNLLFGFIVFVVLYYNGLTKENPAVIGAVSLRMPAYQVGLQPGDDIKAIDELNKNLSFEHLLRKISLSGAGQVVRFEVVHQGQSEPVIINVKPEKYDDQDNPKIGVGPMVDLKLGDRPVLPLAGFASPLPNQDAIPLKEGDRVVAAGPVGQEPQKVTDPFVLNRILIKHARESITVVVNRNDEKSGKPVQITLPPNRYLDLGLQMTLGKIINLRLQGPAASAGVQIGDVLKSIDGVSVSDWDPLRISEAIADRIGKKIEVVVERAGQKELVKIQVEPQDLPTASLVGVQGGRDELIELPTLGLACEVTTTIQKVEPNSPAAQAGLKPGDVISGAEFQNHLENPKKPKPIAFDFTTPGDSWSGFFESLQMQPEHEVSLTVKGQDKAVKLKPVANADWINPYRGLTFDFLVVTSPAVPLGESIVRGFNKTRDNALTVYYFIVRMAQQRVSSTRIGSAYSMYQMGRASLSLGYAEFFAFLAMLSINLAVVNFLPFWPLDGGQILLLLGELIRGRPLPKSWLAPIQNVGLVLVLMLIVWAVGLDVFVRMLGWFGTK